MKRFTAILLAFLLLFNVIYAAYDTETIQAADLALSYTLADGLSTLLFDLGVSISGTAAGEDLGKEIETELKDSLDLWLQSNGFGAYYEGDFTEDWNTFIDSIGSGAMKIKDKLWEGLQGVFSDGLFGDNRVKDSVSSLEYVSPVADPVIYNQFVSDVQARANNVHYGHLSYVLCDKSGSFTWSYCYIECFANNKAAGFIINVGDDSSSPGLFQLGSYSGSDVVAYKLFINHDGSTSYTTQHSNYYSYDVTYPNYLCHTFDGAYIVEKPLIDNVDIYDKLTDIQAQLDTVVGEDGYIRVKDIATGAEGFPAVHTVEEIADAVIEVEGTADGAEEKDWNTVIPGIANPVIDITDTPVDDVVTDTDADAPADIPDIDLGAFADIKTKFPFCIPFDLVALLNDFGGSGESAEPPVWAIDLKIPGTDYIWHFAIDMSDYDEYIEIFREGFFLLFLLGVFFFTRKLISWQID